MASIRTPLSWDDLARDMAKARDALREHGFVAAPAACAMIVIAKRIDELECAIAYELDYIGERLERG